MRLINTRTLELHEFYSENTPPYAILSHAWGQQEVTFQDWQNHQVATSKEGYSKIQNACYHALQERLEWLWVDTNCIDKSSSAELTEAINSMFAYYQKSEVCFAYLSDVPTVNVQDKHRKVVFSQIRNSRWFTRGWTLQELIAPKHLVFYAADWSRIGRRKDGALADLITSITKIDMIYLNGRKSIHQACVAERMSWLSKRTTTRTEDMAYCMLGIFDINMPLLYGEGKRAFFRLQEEIIKSCNDHTIFCWDWNADVPGEWASLLAPWPTAFEGAGEFEKLTSNEVSVFSMTNAGLSIRLPVIHTVATLWRIGSSSWFIMLQAAPASTILDHPESACIRVWGDKIGDVLYVSRDPYPPRPITISRECVRNFRVESLLVMNKIANGQVRATKGREQNIDDPRNFNFIPIFDSSELAQRWKFENTYGEGAKASHLYGAITISSEKQVAVVLTDMRAIPGKCEASLPYVLLGVKPKHDSYYASAKLIKARQGNSALESPRLDKTLRSWRQKVMMGGSIAPGGHYNKKLRITTVLEQSMDVIRQRRNYNFLCFYQGEYYVSGNSQLADSQEDQGNGGDDSDIASNVAVAPNSDWNL